jgi:HK97 family phage portal protein
MWKNVADFLFMPDVSGTERKNFVTKTVPQMSADAVEDALMNGYFDGADSFSISAVHACARVIAEGLALPPCYVHRQNDTGKKLATKHPLYYLLNGAPNDRQTSYEFREQIGWHLALRSNAYIFVNRLRDGTIYELLPCDPGKVTIEYDDTRLWGVVRYYLYGVPVDPSQVWHLKGPSWFNYKGNPTVSAAAKAMGLAAATEQFGSKLFQNGARPGGIIAPRNDAIITPEQAAELKEQWAKQQQGSGNAHKTLFLTGPLTYTSMASTADEAQFIETRKFQIEEICRFFRVSPIKVFQQDGSQSYASVEQAHIAHDQDTDAHWHERFVQSANKNLLTDKERAAGYCVTIDNRSILRGTAGERMAYYTAGKAAGILTTNECREMEGFDRSDDPDADKLQAAANIFGAKPGPDAATVDQTPKNKG